MEGIEPTVSVSSRAPESPNDLHVMVEKFRELSPRDQTSRWLGAGEEIIKKNLSAGFFNEETKPQADKAILYQGGDVNPDSSESLRATLHCLKAIGGDEAVETRDNIAKYVSIKFEEKFYSPDEWQEKLAQATPEEKARLEGEGLYGFVFPEESKKAEAETTQSVEGKSPEDRIITKQLSLLEGKIKTVLQKGGRPTEEQQQLIGALRLAKEAKGEAGVLIKEKALRELKQSGVFGLENTIESLSEEVSIARDKLFSNLKGQGWSEGGINGFIEAVRTGNVEGMIREGKFPEAKGLDKLFFGRELKDEELQRLLDPEKKKNWPRNALLFALLISAITSVTLVEQVGKTR